MSSSLSCKLPSEAQDVISILGIFLEVVGIFNLPKVVDCLFGSRLVDAAVDVGMEGDSISSQKLIKTWCDIVLFVR